MSYQLGIDLGTTYTAAAVCRSGRAGPSAAEPVNLGTGAATIPSVLYIGADGSILVGDAAERRAINEPDRVVREFKRRIGDETPFILGGREYRAHELAALLVRWVTDRVAERAGGAANGITVTHPASWRAHKKELLGQALERIGRRVTFLAEPQAAALSYASAERVAAGSTIAVYDLGGGTFDAAVVRKNGTFTLLGDPEGIEHLGGLDFDDLIFMAIQEQVGKEQWEALDAADPNVISAVAQLRRECVEAKIALSTDTEVTIPVLLPKVRGQVKMTRGEFEGMVRGPLDSTLRSLQRTITSAGLTPADLSAVLLVGGSSRIPVVAEMIASEIGRPVALDADPQMAIALGAAQSAYAPTAPTGAPAEPQVGAVPAPVVGPGAWPAAPTPAGTSGPHYPPGPQSGPIQMPQYQTPQAQLPAGAPPYVPPDTPLPATPPGQPDTGPPQPPGPGTPAVGFPGPPSGQLPVQQPPYGVPPGPPPRPEAVPSAPRAEKRRRRGGRVGLIVVSLVIVLGIAAVATVLLLQQRVVEGAGGAEGAGGTGGPPTLAATIKVGGQPDGVAVTPDGTRLYVTDNASNKVSVIDTASNAVLTTFPIAQPVGIAITPDGRRAYIVNLGPNTVSVVDIATNAVTKVIPVGQRPVRIAITGDGTRIYVTNNTDGTVSVIDPASEAVVGTIQVADKPDHPTLTPDQRKLYITSPGSDMVSIVDVATNQLEKSFPSPGGPFTISFSPDGSRGYLTNNGAGTLSVLDISTSKVITAVAVGKKPVRAVTTPDGRRVFVTLVEANTVSVMDTSSNAVIATIPVDTNPSDAVVTPDGSRVYLTSFGTGTVSVISTGS